MLKIDNLKVSYGGIHALRGISMPEGKTKAEIGLEILRSAQSELYLNFPYLDAALCGLQFQPGDGVTLSLATDGERLLYDSAYLSERFLRGMAHIDRAYLHGLRL